MQSFRQRILDNIHRMGMTSVPELSKILGISKPAVQYHIKLLLADGEIEVSRDVDPPSTRGRPVKCYQIARQKHPHNFETLSNILLKQVLSEQLDTTEQDKRLQSLARSMAGDAPKQASFVKQIDQAVHHLTLNAYQPHWEVVSQGSVIRLRNCPYARILSEHPELCRMDAFLLENLLEIPVKANYVWKDQPEGREGCEFFFKR